MKPEFKIPADLVSSIISSQSYNNIYELSLKKGETLEMKFIGHHNNGAILYRSRLGTIGFFTQSVDTPDPLTYKYYKFLFNNPNDIDNSEIRSDMKEHFEVAPEIIMTGMNYTGGGYATAQLDRILISVKPGSKSKFDRMLAIEAVEREEHRIRWAKEEVERKQRLAKKKEEDRIRDDKARRLADKIRYEREAAQEEREWEKTKIRYKRYLKNTVIFLIIWAVFAVIAISTHPSQEELEEREAKEKVLQEKRFKNNQKRLKAKKDAEDLNF